MKRLLVIIFALLVSSCGSGFSKFYKPYASDEKLKKNAVLLKENETPVIYSTKDFDKDRRKLNAKHYGVIGFSSFNGKFEGESAVLEQARKVGATLVLVKSHYTNTETITSNLYLPDNKTTYQSGTGYGNTTYNNAYGQNLGSSSSSINYTGTSTTYGTKIVPITTQHKRYDQAAMFFAKVKNRKYKHGVMLKDLNDEQKAKLERNSGAVVYIVYEDTPAFYANVLQDDILLKINGTDVYSVKHAITTMRNIPATEQSATYTVLRNGKKKNITLKF